LQTSSMVQRAPMARTISVRGVVATADDGVDPASPARGADRAAGRWLPAYEFNGHSRRVVASPQHPPGVPIRPQASPPEMPRVVGSLCPDPQTRRTSSPAYDAAQTQPNAGRLSRVEAERHNFNTKRPGP
jgi:hypothetical protein